MDEEYFLVPRSKFLPHPRIRQHTTTSNKLFNKKMNDLAELKKGYIKTIKETTFKAEDKFGEITKGDFLGKYKLPENITIKESCENRSEGNKIEKNFYNSNGILDCKHIFLCDNNGNVVEAIRYNADNKLIRKCIFIYNEKGKRVGIDIYDPDDNIDSKITYRYDYNDRMIEDSEYYANGELYRNDTYNYDDKGSIINEIHIGPKNLINKNEKYEYTYKYDDKGNMIEQTDNSFWGHSEEKWDTQHRYTYDENGNIKTENIKYNVIRESIDKYIFIYYENGNIIEKRHDILNNMVLEEISKYNNNNIIEWEGYNSDGSLYKKCTYAYDDEGHLIEENEYYSDGGWDKNTYLYNEKGMKIESILNYFTSGLYSTVISKYTYEYDNNGKVIEENTYNSNNILTGKTICKYDFNSNIIEKNEYCEDGKLFYKIEYNYNFKGKLIEENWYNSEGRRDKKFTFLYDEKLNLMEKFSYNMLSSMAKEVYKYDYDINGNWVKEVAFRNGIPQTITEREIEYF